MSRERFRAYILACDQDTVVKDLMGIKSDIKAAGGSLEKIKDLYSLKIKLEWLDLFG